MINNIVIIEDEKLNADRLKRLIMSILPAVTIDAVLESVSESIIWFREHSRPDLVLMDIRLSDGISFDIFKSVTIECPVIFTTAYDEYALQAFKYNGIDYLLKPIEPEELEKAVSKVSATVHKNHDAAVIESLLDQIRPKDFRKRFLLPFKDGYKAILVNDVAYISVEYGITTAHMTDKSEVMLMQSMEELEQQLDPQRFFRANRQYIVNIEAVSEIRNYFNGKLKVFLKATTDEIIVSRNKALSFKSWLDS